MVYTPELNISVDVSNELDSIVNVPINIPKIEEYKLLETESFLGSDGMVSNLNHTATSIDVKVRSSNPSTTDSRSTKFLYELKLQHITSGEIYRYAIWITVTQPPSEKSKVEEETEKKETKDKEIAKKKKAAREKAKELANKALGSLVSSSIVIGEQIITEAIKKSIGIDVSAAQLTEAISKLAEEIKKSKKRRDEKKKKLETEKDKKQKLMLEQEVKELDKDIDKSEKEKSAFEKKLDTIANDMINQAKEGAMGSQLYQDANNIGIQSKSIMDGSKTLFTTLTGIPTEGVGASQTGTAGPYPAVTVTAAPSMPQVISTAKRVQSQGQSMAPSINSLMNSAANLMVPDSITAPITGVADIIGTISSVPIP